MKKFYIKPEIIFEELENDNVMIGSQNSPGGEDHDRDGCGCYPHCHCWRGWFGPHDCGCHIPGPHPYGSKESDDDFVFDLE